MVRFEIDFLDNEKFESLIRYIAGDSIYTEARGQMEILGQHCADNMIDTIESSRINPDRGTHKLENAITSEILDTVEGIEVGIGRISKLIAEAPYFEMIDEGFTYTTKQTHLVPTTYFAYADSKFVLFKEGSKHTIEGIQYTFKAIQKLDIELTEVITKLGGKFLDGMAKT